MRKYTEAREGAEGERRREGVVGGGGRRQKGDTGSRRKWGRDSLKDGERGAGEEESDSRKRKERETVEEVRLAVGREGKGRERNE